MPFTDNLTLFKSRLAANLPQASLSDQSLIMGLAQAFLSADADTQALITNSQPDMFLSTAADAALDRKAADYGARRGGGQPATVQLTLSTDQPVPAMVPIPAGTLFSTIGDGQFTDAVFFSTTEPCYIPLGGTVAQVPTGATTYRSYVFAQATQVGTIGNVDAHTILVSSSGLVAGLLNVDNPLPAYGGQDRQSDSSLRAAALSTLLSKYAPHALEAAILAVPGVFDAFVEDPQDGGGYVNVYWGDVLGNQPGLNLQGTGAQIQVNTLADQVNLALLRVLPPNVLAAYYPFDVFEVQPSATYMAPQGFETSALTPLIQQAMADYVNGLLHGQPVTLYGMVQYVSEQVGGVLLDFVPMVSPSIATSVATATTLYRYSGDPAFVTVVRLN